MCLLILAIFLKFLSSFIGQSGIKVQNYSVPSFYGKQHLFCPFHNFKLKKNYKNKKKFKNVAIFCNIVCKYFETILTRLCYYGKLSFTSIDYKQQVCEGTNWSKEFPTQLWLEGISSLIKHRISCFLTGFQLFHQFY